MNENDKFLLRHGGVANKIRLIPQQPAYDPLRSYHHPSGGGSLGVHTQYIRELYSDEKVLERMDIKVIEKFLRKKKLLNIGNL